MWVRKREWNRLVDDRQSCIDNYWRASSEIIDQRIDIENLERKVKELQSLLRHKSEVASACYAEFDKLRSAPRPGNGGGEKVRRPQGAVPAASPERDPAEPSAPARDA